MLIGIRVVRGGGAFIGLIGAGAGFHSVLGSQRSYRACSVSGLSGWRTKGTESRHYH